MNGENEQEVTTGSEKKDHAGNKWSYTHQVPQTFGNTNMLLIIINIKLSVNYHSIVRTF